MKLALKFGIIFAMLLSASTLQAQSRFGKNKTNYTPFSWNFIPTKNFDIYFTEGGYETALIASRLSEAHFEKLANHWQYHPKRRIPIIVYNSHNDFSQTNVILENLEEGVGGFTELFKNRVVIPWDGSLAKFKHVIDHELTHALMFDMLYGGVMESIVGREYLFQLPLWFAEGLSEHESQYWGTEADMIVRDGITSGYFPPIQNIYGGYLVYKGGESFFKFLQEKYGRDGTWMAGEVLKSVSMTKNVEKSYKEVFGKSVEELSKEWHRELRTNHWPEVAGRELAEDFSLQLTDHTEEKCYLNNNPAFNPTGDKIAFLTNRSGYKEIMLMRAADGKIIDTIVKGEKAEEYEEMHWLRGGLTWSPDGSMVAFATKSGKYDAIHIQKLDDNGFDKKISPITDAIFTPSWSPNGDKILYSALVDGKLDIFTVDIESEETTRLTNDYFEEVSPKWNADGTKIVFSSDRRDVPYEHKRHEISHAYDIFTMNADGSDVRHITSDPANDRDPYWSPDGKHIVFSSDRNGINNLYVVNLESMTVKPLTNLLTGAFAPNWSPDGNRIAFTSFKEGGWDIYVLKRPLQREISFESINPTAYQTEVMQQFTEAEADSSEVILEDKGTGQAIALEHVPQKPYKLKFTPDMFNAFASYNTFYGVGGMGQLSLSDIMGNHRINVGGNLYYSIEESDMYFSYYYLKHRTNYGFQAYHYKNYYYSTNWDIFSDRIYGGSFVTSRPFSKFSRLDLSLNLLALERSSYQSNFFYQGSSYYDDPYGYYFPPTQEKLDKVDVYTAEVEYVKDNVLWGYTGPINGKRYKLNLEYSPPIAGNDLSYTTLEADYRKYYRVNNRFNIVTRFSGGMSVGDAPRMFFLGGTSYWLNADIASIPSYIENRQDLFFARFSFPLRGYSYYELYGSKYFLSNLEFRFPFIDYLILGWPVPIALGNISGVVFTDIGSAWEKYEVINDGEEDESIMRDKSFHGAGQNENGSFYLDDIKMTWGVGLRMNMGFAVIRLDTAWKVFLAEKDPKPMFSISIGPDF